MTSIPLADVRSAASARFLHEEPHTPAVDDLNSFEGSRASQHQQRDIYSESIRPTWRRNLFDLLERPESTFSAFVIHVFITALICLSAVVTVLETMPAFKSGASNTFFFGFETSLVALFTVEYLARCLAWSSTWRVFFGWFGSFNGVCDLLAICPYYIEIALQQDTSVFFRFSILRVFRLLRVFRPFRSNNTILLTIEVMYITIRRSQHALYALSFFILMVLTVFSTLLYFAERGTWDENLGFFVNSDGDPSQFSSIPAAAWFVLVTMTTIGYGEITPRSFLGRLITVPLLLCGLLLIALPSFVLGREFSIVWDDLTHGGEPAGIELPMRSATLEVRGASRLRDLSNRKLAQNQTELSKQIVDLRALVIEQNKLLHQLMHHRPSTSTS
jgi:potassium voltage-gated channel Shal-related subfamily D protein 2